MDGNWILYGANGYTGRLLVEQAVKRGHRPLLAGRNREKVEAVAREFGLQARAVDLARADDLRALVRGHALVLHAAGPFAQTSAPMVEACLAEGASYLDITGELPVFRAVFARGAEAKQAGVALISGVGFDVVPTDCLAVHVARRVPGATQLQIALAMGNTPSAGTAKSMVGMVGVGAFTRRGGAYVSQRFGRGVHRVRFAAGERWAVPAPIGDLETVYHSTGVPNITTSLVVSSRMARALRVGWPALNLALPLTAWVLDAEPVRRAISSWLDRHAQGPDAATRAQERTAVWARATDGGASAEAWLDIPEGYDFTQHAAILAVERVLAERPTGALSPAMAFGADFVLQIPDTTRSDTL